MDKYQNNRLAEELDLIVLTTSRYQEQGFSRGAIGTLVYSYTGIRRPMFGEFKKQDKRVELSLRLHDFRVLNPSHEKDVKRVSLYLKNGKQN